MSETSKHAATSDRWHELKDSAAHPIKCERPSIVSIIEALLRAQEIFSRPTDPATDFDLKGYAVATFLGRLLEAIVSERWSYIDKGNIWLLFRTLSAEHAKRLDQEQRDTIRDYWSLDYLAGLEKERATTQSSDDRIVWE